MIAFMNNVKTAMLLGGLFALIVAIGAYMGGYTGLIIAGVIALVMNFSAWFYSDTIAVKMMRGQEVDERTAPQLYHSVRKLADRAGLPMPRVYVCPHQAPNAFATGRSPKHSAVAFTQGALQLLDQDELEGVIAHELAHIKNRDTLTSTVAATVAGLFSMMAQWMFLFMHRHPNPLAMFGMILLGAFGAAMIKAMISRAREFVADADGAKIAGSPYGLMNALNKLDAYARRIPMQQPNPAMNNLFIVEPFVGKTLTNLFASHPPTEKRIAALRHLG